MKNMSESNTDLIAKPSTTIRCNGENAVVKYNPGLMSGDRAVDLVCSGVYFFCAPMFWALGHQYLSLAAWGLALFSLYDGLRRPQGEGNPVVVTYENDQGCTVRYNPGLMSVKRALALLLSGVGLVEAPLLLAAGYPVNAALALLTSIYMFCRGMQRPAEDEPKKIRCAQQYELEERSEVDRIP